MLEASYLDQDCCRERGKERERDKKLLVLHIFRKNDTIDNHNFDIWKINVTVHINFGLIKRS